MSNRRQLDRRLQSYGEIGEIMNAMKSLAMIETLKLMRFIGYQRKAVGTIEAAARDFVFFYGHLLPAPQSRRNVYLLFGTERGFCGNLNESLGVELDREWQSQGPGALVLVGSRVASRLGDDPRVTAGLVGASAVEEVESIFLQLAKVLRNLPKPVRFTVLYHRPDSDRVTVKHLNPFPDSKVAGVRYAHPPRLNLDPVHFLQELGEQYLFAALHEVYYSALLAENQRRVQHMDGALRRLDERSVRMVHARNRLRQEEITEEIEVIMLSPAAVE